MKMQAQVDAIENPSSTARPHAQMQLLPSRISSFVIFRPSRLPSPAVVRGAGRQHPDFVDFPLFLHRELSICLSSEVHHSLCTLSSLLPPLSPVTMTTSKARDYPFEYLLASAFSATINYPLWRASALAQSGFRVVSHNHVPQVLSPYLYAFAPPYKGLVATIAGMTWARAAIFWGSDAGKDWMLRQGMDVSVATVAPPLVTSTMVQIVNMPIVRATITIQNPQSTVPNVWQSLQLIYRQHGVSGLWHGTSAGILKTVPKYCTAVLVKDAMDQYMLPEMPEHPLLRSAYKASAAGIAGAALTNPLDVIRNYMFQTNTNFVQTVTSLYEKEGLSFVTKGMGKNMIAVAIPVSCTIFFTDALIRQTRQRHLSS
jgi:hypothetical protein